MIEQDYQPCGKPNPDIPDQHCELDQASHEEQTACTQCNQVHGGFCVYHDGREQYTWKSK